MSNIMKKIGIVLILLVALISIHSIANAELVKTEDPGGNFNGVWPTNTNNGITGMFPQKFQGSSGRSVYLSDTRFLPQTKSWKATMAGGITYCSDYHAYVRFAKKEEQEKYLYKSDDPNFETVVQGVKIDIDPSYKTVQEAYDDAVQAIYEKWDDINNTYRHIGTSRDDGTLEKNKVENAIEWHEDNKKILENESLMHAIGIFDKTTISGDNSEAGQVIKDAFRRGLERAMTSTTQKVFDQLNEGNNAKRFLKNDANDDSTNSEGAHKDDAMMGAVEGPRVLVMENGETEGYSKKQEYSFSNEKLAFIFSACENVYGEDGTYAQRYSVNDIQTAYWQYLARDNSRGIYDDKNSRQEPTGHITGTDLYEKSEEYENFINEIMGGDLSESNYQSKTKINTSEAQVIADRGRQEYIVGPFSVNYPYVEDISYIRSISVTNGSSTLIYDEKNSKLQIVLDNNSNAAKGSNGLTKLYPNDGQRFFIIFKASDLGNPSKIKLNVQFEYLKETNVKAATLYATEANTYQYKGYCLIGEENYNALVLTFKYRVSYAVAKADYKTHGTNCPANGSGECINTSGCEWVRNANDWLPELPEGVTERPWDAFCIYVPYLKMEKLDENEDGQEFMIIQDTAEITVEGEEGSSSGGTQGNAQRIYQRVSQEAEIDLTMKLGGYVWADTEGGKESVSNGTFDSDREVRVPNVTVTLYQEGGAEIGQTRTNAQGSYLFENLNAMYQYYVKFTYNGQYYQSTTFSPSSTWGQNGWKNNSNAKDVVNERLAYNLKFEKIGSSPENYVGSNGPNETFTKMELLGYTLQKNGKYEKTQEAVIDDFGNLIMNGSSDERTAKMIQYVKDCMIDSYTIADGAEGLYPVPSKFLIDSYYKWQNTPKLLLNGVDTMGTRIGRSGISYLYDSAYYINLGINPRQESDVSIKKDIEKVTLEINGQKQEYTYDTLENKENAEQQWDINVRLSDAYYNTNYSRELYKSDYIYKSSMYGDEDKNGDGIGDTFGKSKKDELEVYVTYKIIVANRSLSIRTRIDEVVDYYDQDLEYIDERSFIELYQTRQNAAKAGKYSVQASPTSKYKANTMTTIDGYDKLYVTGLGKLNADENSNENYLAAGQKAYIYLTFRVKKDNIDNEDWVRLDENIETAVAQGVGKENIAEINGYSTQYAKGTKVPNVGDVSFTPAGIVDVDSNPGNLKPEYVPKDGEIKYEKFEDDTDKAPNLRLILHRDDDATRVISGTVWEDIRNEEIEATATGNGIREEKETLINGVTVQLVELIGNPNAEKKEYVWREFGAPARNLGEVGGYGENNTIGQGQGSGLVKEETPIINYKNLVNNYTFEENHNGQYAFKSFMPGKFVIRFIYGDTIKTVVPNSLGGVNEKSYNGQDYKTTTYQEGISQNKTYEWREKSTWSQGQEILGQVITNVQTFKPDASNNETAYVSKRENQDGYLYDITASDAQANVSDAKDILSRREQVINYSNNNVTNYIAEVLASHKNDYEPMNDRNTLIQDLLQNTKMTAETGLMVIELEYDRTGTLGQVNNNKATYKIQNVDLGLEERPKAQIAIDKKVTNVKVTLANGSILFDAQSATTNVLWRNHKPYDVGYTGNVLDANKFGSIQNIRDKNANKIGLIQLSMDEELMHGATIEITYQITITNVGEVDYKDNLFYYTGNKSENAQIVTIVPNQVIDYVANNLQFDASKNSDWNVIDKAIIESEGLVNVKLKEQLDKHNTIIENKNLGVELVPTLYKQKVDGTKANEISSPLVLTQLITAENSSDDLTYRNIVEIVKTSNTVGRRMEYSVVGNQDPTQAPQELDTDVAERVRILPPFGNAGMHIIIPIVAVIVLVILTGGIIFIKKKILK